MGRPLPLRLPPLRRRRPSHPRPPRPPRCNLLARRPHPPRTRPAPLGRPAACIWQARHRLPPVPPLGQGRPLDQAPRGPRRRALPRPCGATSAGELDLPHLPPRLAPARRARHGPRKAPGLPFGAARPLLAAARPRFVRTGLFQAPRRHAPCPPAWPPRPPERLPAQLQESCWPSPPADDPSPAPWRHHDRVREASRREPASAAVRRGAQWRRWPPSVAGGRTPLHAHTPPAPCRAARSRA